MRYYTFQNETKAYLNRLERENGLRISGVSAKALNDRVEALKKSGVWTRYALGFNDVDGDAYLARANVTNVMGRGEVLWFVRGMKALGLYSNMVAWPMRSYQNAGTGSTVYSLGGLGVYNGTMVNSPTWGRSGILLSGASSSTISIASFPVADLVNGPNVLAFFTPYSGGATTFSTEHFCMRYGNADFIGIGHRGVGSTTNVMCNFYSNDASRYYTNIAGVGNFISYPTTLSFSNKTYSVVNPIGTIISGGTPIASSSSRTSPNTLSIESRAGNPSCLVEFLYTFQDVNTINSKPSLISLFNKTLRSPTIFY